MFLLKLPQLQATYGMEIYGIDWGNGVIYVVYPQGMKQLDMRGQLKKEDPLTHAKAFSINIG